MAKIEVWIMTDSNGDYAVGKDAESVAANFDDDIGTPTFPVRMDRFTANVELPKTHEASLSLPLSVADAIQAEPTGK